MLTENEAIALSGDTEDINVLTHDHNLSELTLVFPNVNSILIPKKAEYNLRKYVPKAQLREIDPDEKVAVEKCLVMLSNLASTYYTEDQWKPLRAKILHEQTRNDSNEFTYKRIIEVLKAGTKNGPIIEVDDSYATNVESKKYRIADPYFNAGLTEYIIQDSGLIQRRNRLFYEQLNEAMDNPICRNLIRMYPKIELPTSEQLLTIGKRLAKEGYQTKKGKTLTIRNKHKDHYWSDCANRSFVEDNIKLFEFLTRRGFMIPAAGSAKSGGRVVDSFTLMPSWIREQITIDGMRLTECDYAALHPNIAVKLYGGNNSHITHQKIAQWADMALKSVKVEHLAFFNKRWQQMEKSPLFDYYQKHEPQMLEAIRLDKQKLGYKVTSMRLFKDEVEIMTKAITYLNSQNIHVLYVYDALLCEEKDKRTVTDTMNRVVLECNVQTSVKTALPIATESFPKFGPEEQINLYEVLPVLSMSVIESVTIIEDFNRSNVQMKELIAYVNRQRKEQKYKDYKGVPFTPERLSLLKRMIAA